MQQDVFILGAPGKVGGQVVSQIIEKDTSSDIHANPTRIVGLASSKFRIYNPNGIPDNQVLGFSSRRFEGEPMGDLADLLRIVGGKHDSRVVTFVDVTAESENMLDFHLNVIRNTNHKIVTANKLPLTICDFDTFQTLTNRTDRYGFRSSVMAGAEAVTKLQDLKDLNDELISIRGAFSGTLGYITTELQDGHNLSSAVKDAWKMGYTEPHPAQDLDGTDVARKALILARTAGLDLNMGDIKLEPFIPIGFLKEPNVEQFLWDLRQLDLRFSRGSDSARVLRYIATVSFGNTPKIEVKSIMLDKDDQFAALKGNMNMITIVSRTYNQGYSVIAPGAGVEITAQNIRRDLLYQLARRESNPKL